MPMTRPESLINAVARAEEDRRTALGHPPVHFITGQRGWIEPFFNLVGRVWGGLLFLLPWSRRKPFVQAVFRKLGGHAPGIHPELSEHIRSTVQLAKELRVKTGQWPALLIATSHPDTEGSDQWMRFELMAQGVAVADAVVEAQQPGKWFYAHPRCLLAIDPFALDTLSAVAAGIYAGWMHQIYLAYDRQSSTQSWLQRWVFLKKTGYPHIFWRFLRFLKTDTPILMAYGGGLPYNSRLLYGSREFVQRLPVPQWKQSKRSAQLELLQILLKPEGSIRPADKGELSPGKKPLILQAMSRWGVPTDQLELALQDFETEFKKSVPCRERLLKILYSRLVKKGKPLIILPIAHLKSSNPIVLGNGFSLDPQGQDFRPFCQLLANIFDPPASKV